jgi:hypothetical protein
VDRQSVVADETRHLGSLSIKEGQTILTRYRYCGSPLRGLVTESRQ